jgi:hypothetical protein
MASLYTFGLFLSSLLLFIVEPMFGRMILPMFGGSSSVWLTALVFFQLMLLAGYFYVHATTAWLGLRKQAALHMVVLALPFAVLPVRVLTGGVDAVPEYPLASVTWTLLLSIGLPFFALAASAPLLQRWFAASGPVERDPYFLYAASNLGSLGGLLAYPIVIEPLAGLHMQSRLWAISYAGLVLLVVACATMLWRGGRALAQPPGIVATHQETPVRAGSVAAASPAWTVRLRWLALAALPSSLLVSVTSTITTDFPIPLFWVVPLAIYLASFALVFARQPILPHHTMSALLPFAVVVPLVLFSGHVRPSLDFVVFPLFALFVVAMVCHGELAASRPAVVHLTDFYLWISAGGAIGGLFNAVVAPLVFKTGVEFPLALVLACLVAAKELKVKIRGRQRSQMRSAARTESNPPSRRRIGAEVIGVALLVVALEFGAARWPLPVGSVRFVLLVFAAPALLALRLRRERVRLALVLGAIVLAAHLYNGSNYALVATERSFYGLYRVLDRGEFRMLYHGSTNHGAQSQQPQRKCVPLTYYFPTGPLGHVFDSFKGADAKSDIAVIGLGTGSTAGYARPEQRWTFYEIDPAVERIARNPRYFTFLRDCAPQARVMLGDARISLARQPDGLHDVMIFDAFNSDAVPVHLLTREAFDLYLRKLSPRGVLAFHISSRYFDLRPVLSRLARDAQLVAYFGFATLVSPAEQLQGKEGSVWVIMARKPGDIEALRHDKRWIAADSNVEGAAWTDDYADVLGSLTIAYDVIF